MGAHLATLFSIIPLQKCCARAVSQNRRARAAPRLRRVALARPGRWIESPCSPSNASRSRFNHTHDRFSFIAAGLPYARHWTAACFSLDRQWR